jgi:hypothetical protein
MDIIGGHRSCCPLYLLYLVKKTRHKRIPLPSGLNSQQSLFLQTPPMKLFSKKKTIIQINELWFIHLSLFSNLTLTIFEPNKPKRFSQFFH